MLNLVCSDALIYGQQLPPSSVQCIITSPPYFGQRRYSDGADELGQERTPEEYIDKLSSIFMNLWDALHPTGTLWINIGDAYAGSGRGWQIKGGVGDHERRQGFKQAKYKDYPGYKSKDLIGIPWMLAFALRANGWYLRQDIIWHKPNPHPESVLDRCTKAHEYIFLLSKSKRYQFFPILEPAKYDGRKKTFLDGNTQKHDPQFVGREINGQKMRNKRSVWSINVGDNKTNHTAAFPMELIIPMLLASTKMGQLVCDPFMGSGTTALASLGLGRSFTGCDIIPEYVGLTRQRVLGLK